MMAAGARDFTTLTDLKAWLPVSGTNEDGALANLITNLSFWMENELSRSIFITTQSEDRDGTGTARLLLTEWPIVSVTNLTIDGVVIQPSVLAGGVYTAGYFFTETLIGLRGMRFTRGDNNVHIDYTAGYATLNNPSTVPQDLQQSALELAALRYKERPMVGIGSKSLGGETITFNHDAMPQSVIVCMDNYRRRLPL